MMIVTHATGFLGSCMISQLNRHNFNYLVAADTFDNEQSAPNLAGKKIAECLSTPDLLQWLDENYQEIEFIFHLYQFTQEADSKKDSTEADNLMIQQLWQKCTDYQIPFIFSLPETSPLTDWVVNQSKQPFFWAGLQLPVVYGPNEYYLKDQASSMYRYALEPRKAPTAMSETRRQYVYVLDVIKLAYHFVHHRKKAGFYAVGTGKSYTEADIHNIIDNIRTGHIAESEEKNIPKALQQADYQQPLTSLESGLHDYLTQYLKEGRYF